VKQKTRTPESPDIDGRELIAISAEWYWEQDAELRFTCFSSAELEAAGMREDAFIGKRRWESGYHGVSEAQWAEHRAVLERREPFRDFIGGRYRADGSESFVAVSGRPHFDAGGNFLGYRGISRDVTARVATERALRESEERYRALTDMSPAAIYVQVEGILRYVNPATLRLFGEARAADLIGRPLLDWIHPADRGEVLERMNRINAQGASYAPSARRFVRRDGTEFIAEVTAAPYRYAGVRGGIAVVRDITERQRAEERVLALNAELEARVHERTRQLEEANRELESFSYSVSHDLRAPLRAIHGFSELLAQQAGVALQGQARHYLERVQEAGARMGRLIEALLTLSRVTRAPVRSQEVDLSRLAALVVEELRAGEPRRDIAVEIAPGLAARGDPALLRGVLQNLIENAWKFTQGRVQPRIEVSAVSDRRGRAFCVRDDGVGFDMRHAEKLFGAFQRLHTEQEFSGTGIGLATVQRIVARHGGRVWAEGEPDRGAAFFFTLPEAPPPSAGG
jgi:PAS domain S-box-containing protein